MTRGGSPHIPVDEATMVLWKEIGPGRETFPYRRGCPDRSGEGRRRGLWMRSRDPRRADWLAERQRVFAKGLEKGVRSSWCASVVMGSQCS
jgi:hypothetical protein